MPLSNDKLQNQFPSDVFTVAYSTVNSLQGEDAELQALALAMALMVVCSTTGDDPRDLLNICTRMVNDQVIVEKRDQHRPLAALQHYVRDEFGNAAVSAEYHRPGVW